MDGHDAPVAEIAVEAAGHRERVQVVDQYGSDAERGDAEAQNALGFAYETGRGVDRDYGEALAWYRRAAEQGHAEAQTNAGSLHSRGLGTPRDHAKAAEYYLLAAEQGYGRAQAKIGALHFLGQGVPRDYAEARRWLRPAAEQGNLEAQWRLCVAHARGLGVDENRAKAKAWCLPAAEAGHVWAQEELGRLYDRSSPPDYRQALEWYGLASAQGSATARLRMHSIYREGRRGVRRDLVKALAYLDYAQFGRTADGGKIVVAAGFGNPPCGSAGGGWMRCMLTAKMSKRRIAEARQLLQQWTGGEAPPDEPVIEYR